MSDKELIKEEIERLKHNTPNAYDLSRFMLLEEIESFIDSLPEKPASEDLEEAMERSVSEEPILEFFATGQPTIGAYNEDSLRNQFEAGAEWQKQRMKETLQTEYEKGRFDMREEMMKDAVDVTIFSELKGSDGSVFQAKSDRFRMDGAKIGDRIKVIPIKIEQQ